MRIMRTPYFILSAVLLQICLPSACHADSLTGGYAMSMPNSISYLRLVQREQDVTRYMQSVVLDTNVSSGSNVIRVNVLGSLSGKSIQLQIGDTSADGTWHDGHITLESPLSGYVARMQFARISVEAWNRLVASFTKKWR